MADYLAGDCSAIDVQQNIALRTFVDILGG
jgi:hypothetical protein